MAATAQNPDALPQLIGEYAPADEWQKRINTIFYGLHGDRLRDYYQTFAAADYRLAHALAADYYERVRARAKKGSRDTEGGGASLPLTPLVILELGAGNGNLAACFLSHLKALDKDGEVYPRVRYVLVDRHPQVLEMARRHAELVSHAERVVYLQGDVTDLTAVKAGTVDRILCNELWNDLPTKLMLRRGGDIEEEYVRPNLSEKKQASIEDWSAFVHAFDSADLETLRPVAPFLADIVWEREYRKVDWKGVPYRKTITTFLKNIDEQVLVPVNVGACLTLREAKRLLAPEAIGFSAFDAGTDELKLLNDPEKPCYSQVGGQFSFIVNFALMEAVAKHEGLRNVTIEPQTEYIGRQLATNVITLMDLLATHPAAGRLQPWEQDRLILKTIRAINTRYESPYERTIEFPLRDDMPAEERESLEAILRSLPRRGVPDTVAYLTESEVMAVLPELEELGYERSIIEMAMRPQRQGIDYYHLACA